MTLLPAGFGRGMVRKFGAVEISDDYLTGRCANKAIAITMFILSICAFPLALYIAFMIGRQLEIMYWLFGVTLVGALLSIAYFLHAGKAILPSVVVMPLALRVADHSGILKYLSSANNYVTGVGAVMIILFGVAFVAYGINYVVSCYSEMIRIDKNGVYIADVSKYTIPWSAIDRINEIRYLSDRAFEVIVQDDHNINTRFLWNFFSKSPVIIPYRYNAPSRIIAEALKRSSI